MSATGQAFAVQKVRACSLQSGLASARLLGAPISSYNIQVT
jgi:hypothetical protein